MVMNENKKREIYQVLHTALNKYWVENKINKKCCGKTIVANPLQRLGINDFEEILYPLCCPFETQDELPTIYGQGTCFVKTPNEDGCISKNIRFSISNREYERFIEADTIRIVIHGISLEFV